MALAALPAAAKSPRGRLHDALAERKALRAKLDELENLIVQLTTEIATTTPAAAPRKRIAYRLEEAAKETGLSRETIKRAITRGDLRASKADIDKPNSALVILETELLDWLGR